MRIVVAPDKLKGSLSALEAAEAMRRGVLRADPGAEVDVCPLADGGEGTAAVLARALGGTDHGVTVTGPMGEPVEARFTLLENATTAVVESAEAIGLSRVPSPRRAPLRATSFGVGELVLAAVRAGARRVLVGLGGTATVDAGAGFAQALGVSLLGVGSPVVAGDLGRVSRIESGFLDPALAGVEILVLSDVDNPLLGERGAVRVYGSQKGVSPGDVPALEAGFAHFASLAGDPGIGPGDGAAGGLGYAFRVFAGAQRTSGIDFVLDATRFDAKLEGAALVLTGEGRLDEQSARGKVVAGVVRRCRARAVPVIALAGAVTAGAAELRSLGLTAAFSLCDGPMSESFAKERAGPLLEALAENVLRVFRVR